MLEIGHNGQLLFHEFNVQCLIHCNIWVLLKILCSAVLHAINNEKYQRKKKTLMHLITYLNSTLMLHRKRLALNSEDRKFSFHGCSTSFGLISVEIASGNKWWCPILAFEANKVRTTFSREKNGENFIILHVCRYFTLSMISNAE